MRIAEKIRTYIESNGMVLKFVAEKSGIPQQKFYRLINGKTEMTLEQYEMICKGLSVDPGYFFKEKFSVSKKQTA